MSPVPLLEALECPDRWNGQTQRPHALYVNIFRPTPERRRKQIYTFPHGYLSFASILTGHNEIFQISSSQERASINTLPICHADPPPDPSRVSASACIAKIAVISKYSKKTVKILIDRYYKSKVDMSRQQGKRSARIRAAM